MTIRPRTAQRHSLIAASLLLVLAVAEPASAQEAQAPAPSVTEPSPLPPASSPETGQTPAAPAVPAQQPAQMPAPASPAPDAEPPVDGSAAPAGAQPAAPAPGVPATAPSGLPGTEPFPSATPEGVAAGDPVTLAEVDGRDENLPHDLTPWGMYEAADWVVKAVMIGLVIASLVTWMIAIAKALEIIFARRRARVGVRRLERANSLHEAIEGNGRGRWRGPVAALAVTAADEAQRSASLSAEGIKERTAIALSRVEARVGRRMSRGTSVLATVGSVSPFVGLFGTVWGIMNSFIAISESNTTNLAVVAPGIAEALLATGIGLVAAIPAVVIYNAFSRSISGYRAVLSDGSALVMRHLSRDLDRGAAGATAPHPAPYAAAE